MLNNPVYIIHETTDYDKFHVDKTNRPIKYGHLQRMKAAIREKNFLSEFPIVVDADMNLLDGQHRLAAARELDVPVYYIVSNTMRLRDVPGVNDVHLGWTQPDHLHHYVEKSYPDYIALQRFTQQFPEIKLSDAIELCHLNGNKDGGWYGDIALGKKQVIAMFVAGDYTVNNLPFAEKVASAVRDFKVYMKTHYKQRQFVRAIANLIAHPQYDHGRMMQKMEYLSAKLRPCVSTSDYLLLLSEIYNYKVRPKDVVEFKIRGKKETV